MPEEDSISRRRGKIAQCPRTIREQLNRMLYDGKQGPEILAWLNVQPEVRALISAAWEGHEVSDNNLSQWFKGGYLEWLAQEEKVLRTQNLADFSLRLAQATGGNMSEGVVAVAAGKILSALESAEGGDLVKLAAGATMLRSTELTKEKVALQRERNQHRREALDLDRERFERETVKLFLRWYQDEEAKRIAASGETEEVQMEKLVQLMFGQRPAAPS